jgi:hypothetical protein
MIKAEQIPDEVVEAVAKSMGWPSAIVFPHDKLRFKGHIAAALNAWPGMSQIEENDSATVRGVACLILPLPLQETPDGK